MSMNFIYFRGDRVCCLDERERKDKIQKYLATCLLVFVSHFAYVLVCVLRKKESEREREREKFKHANVKV